MPPCIQNALQSPLKDTPGEHLAREGPFRCTNPSNHARRANLAMLDSSPLGESRHARWALSYNLAASERLPLGESCHAMIAPAERILPRDSSSRKNPITFCSERFWSFSAASMCGGMQFLVRKRRSSRSPGKRRQAAMSTDKWQQLPPDQTRNAERGAEASDASRQSRATLSGLPLFALPIPRQTPAYTSINA